MVVGPGSEQWNDRRGPVVGLGRVSDGELTYLYQHASALLALGNEDFGLTPLEANLQGAPVVAYAGGGFLETVVDGLNGAFVTRKDAATVAEVIKSVMHARLATLVDRRTRGVLFGRAPLGNSDGPRRAGRRVNIVVLARSTPAHTLGGMERCLADLVEELSSRHSVTVLTTRGGLDVVQTSSGRGTGCSWRSLFEAMVEC